MGIYFSEAEFREAAMESAKHPPESFHTSRQCFFMLMRGSSKGQLENLIAAMQAEFPEKTGDECYELLQIVPERDTEENRKIMALAMNLLDSGSPLGNELVSGKFNTSDYLGHSLLEGRLAGILAGAIGLDGNRAEALGMLHDYGRRATHTFEHTIRGYELLHTAGWEAEALGCLTHSFLNGGRCASNERAEAGFYVDSQGKPGWMPDAEKDDLTVFLEHYHYTDYDRILNIADLMATSHAVVSPMERLRDIATRRELDPMNRGYFLAELINTLNAFYARITGQTQTEPEYRASEGVTVTELEHALEEISEKFYNAYLGYSRKG